MELVTGNKFKNKCHYSSDSYVYLINEVKDGEILKFFSPIDAVHNFFNSKPAER